MESLEGKKGQPRFKPPFPAELRPVRQADDDQQHRDLRVGAGDPAQGRASGSSSSGQAEQRRPEDLFRLRPRQQARQLRDQARHAVHRPARDGRRRAQRSQAEGRDPGRLVDAGAAGRDDDGVTMDYDALQKAGSGLGSGAVIVMDETTCMVRACQRIARFYYAESCGQCTPCREGTGWMYRMLTRIVEGNATMADVEMLQAGRRPDRRPHDLRVRRSRGVAGAGFPAALLARVRILRREQALDRGCEADRMVGSVGAHERRSSPSDPDRLPPGSMRQHRDRRHSRCSSCRRTR